MEKETAVIVRQYNKVDPTKAVDVVEKTIRDPGQGVVELSPPCLLIHRPKPRVTGMPAASCMNHMRMHYRFQGLIMQYSKTVIPLQARRRSA